MPKQNKSDKAKTKPLSSTSSDKATPTKRKQPHKNWSSTRNVRKSPIKNVSSSSTTNVSKNPTTKVPSSPTRNVHKSQNRNVASSPNKNRSNSSSPSKSAASSSSPSKSTSSSSSTQRHLNVSRNMLEKVQKTKKKSIPPLGYPKSRISKGNVHDSFNVNKSTKLKKRKMRTLISGGMMQRVPVKTLREMKYLQTTTFDCIPKLAFSRLVREIMQSFGEFRVQSFAIMGLQTASEVYLTQLFEDSNKCTYHRQKKTLVPNDINLVRDLRSRYECHVNL